MNWYSTLIVGMLVASLAFLYTFGKKAARFVYLTCKIPGPSLWQMVTNHAKHLYGDGAAIRMWELCAAYHYKPWSMWLSDGYFVVVVSDCETVSEIYKNKHTKEKCDPFYKQIERSVGRTFISMPGGREYSQYRKVFTTGLRKNLQESFLPRMFEPMSEFVQEVRKSAAGGKDGDIRSLVNLYLLTLTFVSFTSTPRHNYSQLFELYLQNLSLRFKLVRLETMNPFYYHSYVRLKPSTKRNFAAFKDLCTIFSEAVMNWKSRVNETVQENGAQDMYEAIVPAYEKLIDGEDEKFCGHSLALLVASVDTTSFLANVLLIILALHQDVQQRVFDEISSVLGEKDRPILVEDLDQLKYTEMVIKESMRLFPPAALIGRKTTEETNLNGVVAPKGSVVVVNIMALHRNPEYFPDPLKFDPDRFSPEAPKKIHPYTYMPFSTGMRSCLGQLHALLMMKLFVCYVVRNFKILPGEKLRCLGDIKVVMNFTMHLEESSLRFVDRIIDEA